MIEEDDRCLHHEIKKEESRQKTTLRLFIVLGSKPRRPRPWPSHAPRITSRKRNFTSTDEKGRASSPAIFDRTAINSRIIPHRGPRSGPEALAEVERRSREPEPL